MIEDQIAKVAAILANWNPLGERAKAVSDLDGYRVEATDIIVGIRTMALSKHPEVIVMTVLNQAFDLELDPKACIEPAKQIMAILKSRT